MARMIGGMLMGPNVPAYKRVAKYASLRIEVPSEKDVLNIVSTYKSACFDKYMAHSDFYVMRTYLQHLFGRKISYKQYMSIHAQLQKLRYEIDQIVSNPCNYDREIVAKLLEKNEPYCIHKKDLGLVVKLFKLEDYYTKRVMIKTYIFRQYLEEDPGYEELYQEMIIANFMDEVLFQKYAKQIGDRLDFIVPHIYSYGHLSSRYMDSETGERVWCYYMIMEYVEGVVLKDAAFSRASFKDVYCKREEIDALLRQNLLFHNDLHKENTMVVQHADGTHKIAVLDFGSAATGPTKCLF